MSKDFIIPILFWGAIGVTLIVWAFAPVIFSWSSWWLTLTVPTGILLAVLSPTIVYALAMMSSDGV